MKVVEVLRDGSYAASGRCRQVENAAAQRPTAVVPFGNRAVSVVPAITGCVKSAGIDERPVQKISFGIVRIFICIEYVEDVELTYRKHQAVCRRRAGELIEVGINLLGVAAEIDRLPDEIALQTRVGISRPDLKSLTARKSGYSVCIREAEALIELRTDPQLGTLPQSYADVEDGVPGFAALGFAGQTICAGIGLSLIHI